MTEPRGAAQSLPSSETALSAIAAILSRAVLGASRPDDASESKELLRSCADTIDPIALAASVGGRWAAFDRTPGEIDNQTMEAIVASSRALAGSIDNETEALLGLCTLSLLSRHATPGTTIADLTSAAIHARRIERHDLTRYLADEALATGRLDPSQTAYAKYQLAVTSQSPAEIHEARHALEALTVDDPVRSLLTDLGTPPVSLAGAVDRGDRRQAAVVVAAELERLLEANPGDALLEVSLRALQTLTGRSLDPIDVRAALAMLVAQYRYRLRHGHVPPIARSMIDTVMDLLLLEPDDARGDIIVELLEALAHAGISALINTGPDTITDTASYIETRATTEASHSLDWPATADFVPALDANDAIMFRTLPSRLGRADRVLAVHLLPSSEVSISHQHLDEDAHQTLQHLAASTPGARRVTPARLDGLVAELLPSSIRRRLTAGRVKGLAVVPDHVVWPIPWQSATTLRAVPTQVTRSLSSRAALAPPPGPIRSVTAIVDESITGADPVVASLNHAASRGWDVRRRSAVYSHNSALTDLTIVFCHGGGDGLSYRLNLPDGPTTAVQALRGIRSQRILLAACSSGGTPPAALPLTLATAMTLHGASTVVAGLWPLPTIATGRIVGDLITAMTESDYGLSQALRDVTSALDGPLVERAGLHVFGIEDTRPHHREGP
ncbi:MAG: CHAT domain-containing protein [Actinomycetia bacterium]|nr:CHAT domain-containing protein [Actinomycetes bacterium]